MSDAAVVCMCTGWPGAHMQSVVQDRPEARLGSVAQGMCLSSALPSVTQLL